MIETDIITWAKTLKTGLRAYYMHLVGIPPAEFIFLQRSGEDRLDCLDEDGEPDIVYFDCEIWSQTPTALTDLTRSLRATHGHRGTFGAAYVEDIAVLDQRDDYEPQATGETLPPFASSFRLIITGYQE